VSEISTWDRKASAVFVTVHHCN